MIQKVIRIAGVFLFFIAAFIIYRLIMFQPIEIRPFAQVKRPLTITHRGGKALWPENTLYAFERAVEMGVDVLEFDVRPTADGNVVVIHDATVDRTSNGTGRVDQMTLAELKTLDFAYHFTPAGENSPMLRNQGITISTLEEVFQNFPTTCFCIEIKPDSQAFALQVVDIIRQQQASQRVIIGSFHSRVNRVLRQKAPEIARAADANEVRKMVVFSKLGLNRFHTPSAKAYQVPVRQGDTEIVTPAFIVTAHKLGQEIHVWTINDTTEMRRLLTMGVDGIMTDRPDILLQLRDEIANDKLSGCGT